MAKRKKLSTRLRSEAKRNTPPRVNFTQNPVTGNWTPTITIANIVMPLEPRPFMGFYKGERDAILTWIKQVMSDILFDCPRYLVHEETGKSALNPDWELLPYFEEDKENPGEFVEVEPKPSLIQIEAGNKLPDMP